MIPGTTLGHYCITGLLGKGGMGEVFAAEDTRLKRKVALKILPDDLATDPERLARFRREAEALAALNHPNIVTVYSIEEADGRQFLTMELVEGESLSARITPEGLPVDTVVDWASQIAAAMASAYGRGVIHRDLKPENIVVTAEPCEGPGLRDRSVAWSRYGRCDPCRHRTGVGGRHRRLHGTRAGPRPGHRRADGHFALGAILYEILTGRRAFAGATPADTLAGLLKGDVRPLSEDPGSTLVELERVLHRCLESEPKARFRSAEEVADFAGGRRAAPLVARR